MAKTLPFVSLLIVLLTTGIPFETAASSIKSNHRVKRTTTQEEETIIEAHVKYRSEAGAANMEYMKWSDELSSIASDWVSGCDKDAPDPIGATHSFESIGRNFVWSEGGTGTFDLTQAVLLWNLEKMNYDYATGNCTDGRQCEHYQQLVYATTTHVGCHYQLCGLAPVTILFGCYYGPRADFTVQPYTEGESCSLCTSGSFFCQTGCCIDTCDLSDNECECKAQCDNCGTAKASTCTCECKEGFHGPTCSEGPGDGCNTPAETTSTTPEPTTTTAAATTTTAAKTTTEPPTTTPTTTEAVDTTTVFDGNCPSDYCLNGGTPEVNAKKTGCRCNCPDDYEGYKCNKAVEPEFDGTCPSDYCRNGGTPEVNKKRTRCRCNCPEEYHGYKCNKLREEADKGVEMSVKVNINMFQIIWQVFTSFLVRRMNSYCCFSVQSCCGGASITKAPLTYRFMSSSNVVLGTGFPDGGSSKVSFLYYVRAERQNSLCTYASSRGKRQAIESIELPQDILQSVVEDAQDELATEFLDCCNATIDSIGPGQIYIDEDEGVTPDSKLPIYVIIATVVVAILLAVVIFLVYLFASTPKPLKRDPMQWKPPRGRSNMALYGHQTPLGSTKPVYYVK